MTGIVVLHISDIHFSNEKCYRYSEAFQENIPKPSRPDLPNLLRDAVLPFLQEKRAIDFQKLIVISGDLTDKGTCDQLEKSFELISEIAIKLEIGFENILAVPGNHDILWPENQLSESLNNSYKEARYNIWNCFQNKFRNHMLIDEKNISNQDYPITMFKKFDLKSDVKFIVTGFDSTRLDYKYDGSEKKYREGLGIIGVDQLQEVEKQLPEETSINIAFLHHHLIPVENIVPLSEKGNYSLTLDAKQFIEWLIKNKYKIVLHGHKHVASASIIKLIDLRRGDTLDPKEKLIIIGGNSLAHSNSNNGFNLLILTNDILELTHFYFDSISERFIPYGSQKLYFSVKKRISNILCNLDPLSHSKKLNSLDNISYHLERIFYDLGLVAYDIDNKDKKIVSSLFRVFTSLIENDCKIISYPLTLSQELCLLNLIQLTEMAKILSIGNAQKIDDFLLKSMWEIFNAITELIKNNNSNEINKYISDEKEYDLILLPAIKEYTGEIAIFLREQIEPGWKTYLLPAFRKSDEYIKKFCREIGINSYSVFKIVKAFDVERIRISPTSGLLTRYKFIIHLVETENNALLETICCSNIKHEIRYHYKWFTEEECKQDQRMQILNGDVLEKVWEQLHSQKNNIKFKIK